MRIQATPQFYTGHIKARFSTAPALADGRLQPRREFFRTYLVAANGSYTAMPGGLALNAPQSGHLQGTATRQGTASKDIWVLAKEPQEHVSLWLQAECKDEILESSSGRHRLVANVNQLCCQTMSARRYTIKGEIAGQISDRVMTLAIQGKMKVIKILPLDVI